MCRHDLHDVVDEVNAFFMLQNLGDILANRTMQLSRLLLGLLPGYGLLSSSILSFFFGTPSFTWRDRIVILAVIAAFRKSHVQKKWQNRTTSPDDARISTAHHDGLSYLLVCVVGPTRACLERR
jgi:hypothetical protein